VLAAEAQVRAENTTKWLYESRRGNWRLPDGALVLVDEASMVSTPDLVEIVEQARRAGGKVLLVGDPAQLAAIHISMICGDDGGIEAGGSRVLTP
jgi:ATP-dependent exoDNAse (exonuclease V) alpha subunit